MKNTITRRNKSLKKIMRYESSDDYKICLTSAKCGWEGLMTKISDEYDVKDIYQESSTDPSLSYYYNRPALVNDTHGLATVLLAGTEYLKIKEFYKFIRMGQYLKMEEQKNAISN